MEQSQKEKIDELRKMGMGYRAIANIMGLSRNTVASHIYRQINREQIKPTFCLNCGRRLRQTQGHRQKKFCNEKCRRSWWKDHQDESVRKAYYEAVCQQCGKKFSVYGNNHRKFCSWQCYLINKRGVKN